MNFKKLVKEKYFDATAVRIKDSNYKTVWLISDNKKDYNYFYMGQGKTEYRAWKAAWENLQK